MGRGGGTPPGGPHFGGSPFGPILEVPAGDGAIRSSPEADGEVPEEGADSVVPQ